MIGLSVSFCIKQMADGRVDPATVEKIIGATKVPTKEAMEGLVRRYRKTYWRGFEEKAEALFWRFWAEDKIYQPRIADGWVPNQSNGIWVNSEDEIRKIRLT